MELSTDLMHFCPLYSETESLQKFNMGEEKGDIEFTVFHKKTQNTVVLAQDYVRLLRSFAVCILDWEFFINCIFVMIAYTAQNNFSGSVSVKQGLF